MEIKSLKLTKNSSFLLLTILFFILFVSLEVRNWIYFEQNASSDVAGEYLYFANVSETGNPFSPEFANSNEFFASRSWWIFVPLYRMTGNFLFSCKCTLIITTCLLCLAAVFMLLSLHCKKEEIIIGLLVLFFLTSHDISCVSFRYFNAYVVFVIGMMLTFSLVFVSVTSKIAKQLRFFSLNAIAFAFGLCGLRMILALYFPCVFVEAISVFCCKIQNTSIRSSNFKIFFQMLIFNLCGLFLCEKILIPNAMQNTNFSLHLVDYSLLFSDIEIELMYLLSAFGIYLNGAPVFSLNGISTIFKIILLLLIISGIWIVWKRTNDDFGNDIKKIILYSASSIMLHFLYFIGTDYTGFPRYYFAIPIMITFVVILVFKFLNQNKNVCYLKKYLVVFLLIGIGVQCFTEFEVERITTPQMKISQFLQDRKISRIAATYWNANIVSLLSNRNIIALSIVDTDTLPMYDWITDRTNYVNDDEPLAIVLSVAESEVWQTSNVRSSVLSQAKRQSEFAGYKVFEFEKNPLAFDMIKYGYDARFNVLNLFCNDNAKFINGDAILRNGGALYGPYYPARAGEYTISIRGENLDKLDFDIVSAMGKTNHKYTEMFTSSNEVQLEVNLLEDVTDLEIRTFNNRDDIIVIHDITLQRQNMAKCW